MVYEQISNIIRAVTYFSLSVTSIFIANIYWVSNGRSRKKSRLITSMVWFFVFLAIFFGAMMLVPIVRMFSLEAYLWLTKNFFVFSIPLAVSAIVFWYRVVHED